MCTSEVPIDPTPDTVLFKWVTYGTPEEFTPMTIESDAAPDEFDKTT